MKRKEVGFYLMGLLPVVLLSCRGEKYEPGPQPDISGYYKGYVSGMAGVDIYIAVLNEPGGQMHYYELGATDRDTAAPGVIRHWGSWTFTGNEYAAGFKEDQRHTTLTSEMKTPYRNMEGKMQIEESSEVTEFYFTLKKQ
ncbi:hypothetical protein [Taibaiella koreensis]|uniref:hypothetical protein n=1 Tax=Taibaiella koreensis TaxID=1268548 RepID=UPI000E5A0E10|nr:hypothetical protein [Taibaiella koreensis]